MIKDDIKNIAINFSSLIINGNFIDAYKLTAKSYQKENTLDQMIAEYQGMMKDFGFIDKTLKLSSDFDDAETVADIGNNDIEAFITIDGMVNVEEGEPYETYTVFNLVFTQEGKDLLISFVNFDGRA